MTSVIGSFSKLYSEAIEAVDRKASEASCPPVVRDFREIPFRRDPASDAGADQPDAVLFRIEHPFRRQSSASWAPAASACISPRVIRTYEWDRVAFIVLMVLVTVGIIDFVSSRLRLALVGTRTAHV